MSSKSVNIAVSIPLEMHRWLESPQGKRVVSNKSGLFQEAVDTKRNPTKVNPMSILVMIMGMAFGVGCIVAAATMFFEFLFTTTLWLLGAVVLLSALVTMIKEARRVSVRPRPK